MFSGCIVPSGDDDVAVRHWEVVVLYCLHVDVVKIEKGISARID